MDKHLLDCLQVLPDDAIEAIGRGRVSALPFATYINEVEPVLAGIQAVVEILEIDMLRQADEDEADRVLNDHQKGALMAMIRASAWLADRRACEIAERATERLSDGGGRGMNG